LLACWNSELEIEDLHLQLLIPEIVKQHQQEAEQGFENIIAAALSPSKAQRESKAGRLDILKNFLLK
jgi:hypothetical protein